MGIADPMGDGIMTVLSRQQIFEDMTVRLIRPETDWDPVGRAPAGNRPVGPRDRISEAATPLATTAATQEQP